MANLRNEFEFRSALLTALGVEHTEAEAKNEEMWRRKMLDGLGVEYNQNDVNQFGLFREKLIEGVTNYSGGGSGGGGGSSDFSTAEVTIAPFDGGYTEYEYPLPGVDDVDNTIMILHPIARDDSKTITVPLYKGKLTINTGENIGISGDFVYNSDFGELTITGDCTIKGYTMH